ncbi:Lysine-specific histone demethylase 1 -like protein 2 [Capsicum chinense]|nr:Lysine-specific histone demethylase 1 -like protein 2 [Capsicum chinense]
MVLCTVPLRVLQRRSIRFEPELPEQKLEAIDRLGFGLLNKVAMAFPHLFWREDLDNFGCLNRYSHRLGEFLFFEEERELWFHFHLATSTGIYEPKGKTVPDPVHSICPRWGSDPFSFGSYSHVRVHSAGSDHDIRAENLGGPTMNLIQKRHIVCLNTS